MKVINSRGRFVIGAAVLTAAAVVALPAHGPRICPGWRVAVPRFPGVRHHMRTDARTRIGGEQGVLQGRVNRSRTARSHIR